MRAILGPSKYFVFLFFLGNFHSTHRDDLYSVFSLFPSYSNNQVSQIESILQKIFQFCIRMGFKNFYHYLSKYSGDFEKVLDNDSLEDESKIPWLLVDGNNLFQITLQSGGHNSLGWLYCKEFLIALFKSKFRIRIIIDGECDSLRSVTKMERMVKEVVRESEVHTAEILCPEMVG
jgi:hypothetical protein